MEWQLQHKTTVDAQRAVDEATEMDDEPELQVHLLVAKNAEGETKQK